MVFLNRLSYSLPFYLWYCLGENSLTICPFILDSKAWPLDVSSTASHRKNKKTWKIRFLTIRFCCLCNSLGTESLSQREGFWQKEKEWTPVIMLCSAVMLFLDTTQSLQGCLQAWSRPQHLTPISPPPPSLWSFFRASEIFQTSTQWPQVFCLPQFRENSLLPMHRLTLSFSVYFKVMWVAVSFPESANRGRIGVQESEVKGILHLFPLTSKTDIKVYLDPNLTYRTPKEKQ